MALKTTTGRRTDPTVSTLPPARVGPTPRYPETADRLRDATRFPRVTALLLLADYSVSNAIETIDRAIQGDAEALRWIQLARHNWTIRRNIT